MEKPPIESERESVESEANTRPSGVIRRRSKEASKFDHRNDNIDTLQPAPEIAGSEEQYYTEGWRLFLILFSLLLSLFCQALDDTIIATAIPRIADDFKHLDDVGWYGSAYLLTNAAFQLFYGKLYQILPLRWVFLCALLLFEVGSLIAGVAPTSQTLIAGRAVAGTGAAGITSGALNIMAHVTPITQRPLFMSLIGAVYGVASTVGPILGGTSRKGLHGGGVSMLICLLVFSRPLLFFLHSNAFRPVPKGLVSPSKW